MSIDLNQFQNIGEQSHLFDHHVGIEDGQLTARGLFGRIAHWFATSAADRQDQNKTAINKFIEVLARHHGQVDEEHGQRVQQTASHELAEKLSSGAALTHRDVKRVMSRIERLGQQQPQLGQEPVLRPSEEEISEEDLSESDNEEQDLAKGVQKALGGLHGAYLQGVFPAGTQLIQEHGLTMPELVSIHAYTTSNGKHGYVPMNEALRDLEPQQLRQSPLFPLIHQAYSGVRKMPDYSGVVYRSAPSLPPNVLEQYKVGETIDEKGFTSTSKKQGGQYGYGKIRFTIRSNHGKDVSGISHYKDEEEVLFPPGTRFKVERRVDHPNGSVEIGLTDLNTNRDD